MQLQSCIGETASTTSCEENVVQNLTVTFRKHITWIATHTIYGKFDMQNTCCKSFSGFFGLPPAALFKRTFPSWVRAARRFRLWRFNSLGPNTSSYWKRLYGLHVISSKCCHHLSLFTQLSDPVTSLTKQKKQKKTTHCVGNHSDASPCTLDYHTTVHHLDATHNILLLTLLSCCIFGWVLFIPAGCTLSSRLFVLECLVQC